MIFLLFCARHARWLLIVGLVAGIALPGLTAVMRPWLPELVALMLFLAAFRIGPRQALGALGELRQTLLVGLCWQLALPLVMIGLAMVTGLMGTPAMLALILMSAAAPLAGSPNLTILVGGNPAPALRLLILGTAALPLTVIPVFHLLPELGAPEAILGAVGRLLVTIAVSAGAAFALRLVWRKLSPRAVSAIDGVSALVMTVTVLALMSAVGPALMQTPGRLALWAALAFAANLGPQVVVALLLRRKVASEDLPALAVTAGNRNIALFLVALPPEITDQILLFIGCYQMPMYLTPLLMTPLYKALR